MFLTYFLFLLIIGTIALLFSISDLETPYMFHILGYTLSISIFLFLGYMCLFGRVVFNPELFYQSVGIIGLILVSFASVIFVFMLFEFGNMIRMSDELKKVK
ncbi:hypothetical protein KAW18_02090 [candidate division WOR-3 bacterium]|nr:hypothetical protein [candidate division WOR-3 bacterium]